MIAVLGCCITFILDNIKGGDELSKKVSKTKKAQSRRRKTSPLIGNYIVPTEHAIKRYQERIRMMNDDRAQRAIIEGVKNSRLIALTRFGGREIRENRGVVYVCELHGNYMYVITVLVSQVDLRFVI
jgi:hypothetical protein